MENLISEDIERCKLFFDIYFQDRKRTEVFLDSVFSCEGVDLRPRQMLNMLYRWGSLAKDIEVIRPARDGLKILFMRNGIEAICSIANKESDKKEFFFVYMSDEGKKYILDTIKIYDIESDDEQYHDTLFTIKKFEQWFYGVRNMVTHDGDYWSTQLFSHSNDDTGWLSSIKLKADKKKMPTEIDYYETVTEFERFLFYYIEAGVKYIREYIDKTKCDLLE